MKKIKFVVTIIVILLNTTLQAQTFDNRKFIEVTGSAEMTIQPDEIELEIVLLEYDKNGQKIKLQKIEADFYAVLKKNNVNIETLTLSGSNNYWWYWWYWWYYRNQPYQTKTINIKLNKDTNFLQLVENLNEKWVQSIEISKTTNKETQKFRKEVKIEAIKAAKDKATYLLESIGEQIGGVLSIEEIPEATNFWYNQSNRLSNSNISISNSGNSSDGVGNVPMIKLRYEIKAKFEIK
jgi:uncharacterized protein YggE